MEQILELLAESRQFALRARNNARSVAEDDNKYYWLKVAASWDEVTAEFERLLQRDTQLSA